MKKDKITKRQHYISQRYLKNFSRSGDYLYIFPFSDGKYYSNQIKNLAKEYFYYGSDSTAIKFEQDLGKFERLHNSISKKIIKNYNLDSLNNEEKTLLRFFTLFQEARTKAGKKFSTYFANSLKKDEGQDIDIFQKIPRSITREIGDQYRTTFGWMLQAPILSYEAISDLEIALIINTTDGNFICGDAPVVRFNQLKIFNERLINLFSPGLEIFYPVDNEILLLFYDPRSYDIDFDYDNICYLDKAEDLDSLNKLQFITALDFVLFSDVEQRKNIETLYREIQTIIYNAAQERFGSFEEGMGFLKSLDNDYWDVFCLISKYFNFNLNLSFIHKNTQYEQHWLEKYQESLSTNGSQNLIRNKELEEKVLAKLRQAAKI